MPVIQTEALREKLLKLDELQDGLGTKIVENLEFPICPFHIVQSLSTKLFARIAVAYGSDPAASALHLLANMFAGAALDCPVMKSLDSPGLPGEAYQMVMTSGACAAVQRPRGTSMKCVKWHLLFPSSTVLCDKRHKRSTRTSPAASVSRNRLTASVIRGL